MKSVGTQKGFTLVEVMLASAILTIGLMLVAGAFPVGIKMTATSTERIIGTIAADEAFAKIRLFGEIDNPANPNYGIDFTVFADEELYDLDSVLRQTFNPDEYSWPSTDTGVDKYYNWSTLMMKAPLANYPPTDVFATVFITRVTGVAAQYPNPYDMNRDIASEDDTISNPRPIPVYIDKPVPSATMINQLKLLNDGVNDYDDIELIYHIPEGAVLLMVNPIPWSFKVQILNVIEVNKDRTDPGFGTITLSEKIKSNLVNDFWVIPTAIGSTRNPCIGVYQEQIHF